MDPFSFRFWAKDLVSWGDHCAPSGHGNSDHAVSFYILFLKEQCGPHFRA